MLLHPEQLWSAWRAASLEATLENRKMEYALFLTLECQRAPEEFSLDVRALHTWEVKHFFQVVRIAGLHSMTSSELLEQLVSLCLCLPQTLLQLRQLQCSAHKTRTPPAPYHQSYKCGANLEPMYQVGVPPAVPPSWRRGRSVAVAPKL